MLQSSKTLALAGRVVVVLVGIVLILAGALKLANVGADDMLEGLQKSRLIQHVQLISFVAIACGLLLLVPRVWKWGVFPATAYWGGAIVAHMTYNDSVAMPAVFLAALWVGGFLAIRFECTVAASGDVKK